MAMVVSMNYDMFFTVDYQLVGGFKHVLFSPLFGEMIHFD